MSNNNLDDLLFVFFGTDDYHFLIRKNIELLRRLYPKADVLVYDWGDKSGRPSGSSFPNDVEVIDWSGRIADTMGLLDALGETGLNDLAKAFNSRERASFKRRINKFFLKRLPNSSPSRSVLEQAMRYENLLLHKCYALGDCARRVGERRFFFLDADAYLVERLDDLYEGDPDVIMPMLERKDQHWEQNNCHALNDGIIGFGADIKARTIFLDAWYKTLDSNIETLRVIASLSRMVKAREADSHIFDAWQLATVDFDGVPVKIRTIPNHIYNSVLNHEYDGGDLDAIKVLHLSGVAQNQELFERFIGIVEDVLQQRGAQQ
jgi:hypothetical protein